MCSGSSRKQLEWTEESALSTPVCSSASNVFPESVPVLHLLCCPVLGTLSLWLDHHCTASNKYKYGFAVHLGTTCRQTDRRTDRQTDMHPLWSEVCKTCKEVQGRQCTPPGTVQGKSDLVCHPDS